MRSRCKYCRVQVADENLRRHYANVHPKMPVPESAPQPRRQRQPMTRRTKRALGAVGGGIALLVILAVVLHGAQVSNGYPFPCVSQSLLYHWHTTLTITDSGGAAAIPANTGISAICVEPVHTHDASGTLHVETDVSRHYTVGDFFSIWKKPFGSPTRMLVNGTSVAPTSGQTLWDQETVSLTYSGTF